MIKTALKKKIRQSFSKAAASYEEHALLQRQIGLRLIEALSLPRPDAALLDVGMGTGWLNRRIQEQFPQAKIFGLDLADGMLNVAREHHRIAKLILADAASLPFKPEAFDVIISNLAYQWVDDLAGSLGEMRDVLKTKGKFYLSYFGADSLQEFYRSLEASCIDKGRQGLRRAIAHGERDILYALRANGFGEVRVYCEKIKTTFSDVFELMRWLKLTGASPFRQDVFLGRHSLLEAQAYYQKHFGESEKITATFEVVWATARK